MSATTYTNIGLISPGVGDPSTRNAWGGLLNTDTILIDSIVNGIVSIAVGGTGTTILTFTPGAADQVKHTHFVFTGVLSGDRTVLWPQNVTASFSVQNNTTGAHNLILGANNGSGSAGGTTQTIAQTTAGFYISNGTNVNVRVTSSSVAAIADKTISSNISGGTTTPVGNTLTAILDDILGTTQGAIIQRGASTWAKLDPGTAKQFLQTGGAAANASWGNAPVILESGSVSTGTTDVLVKSLAAYTAFSRIEVDIDNLILSGLSELRFVVSTDGGSNYLGANYAWTGATLTSSYSFANATSAAYISLSGAFAGSDKYVMRLNLNGLGTGTVFDMDAMVTRVLVTAPVNVVSTGVNTSTSVNAFKLYLSTGTVTSGHYRIIGYV